MARFVEIDASNIVIRGVVLYDKDTQYESGNEVESVGAKYLKDRHGGTWKQTSYNTIGGIHYAPSSSTVNHLTVPDNGVALRKNHASIGHTYDEDRDAFYAPQPFDSWTLNEDTCHWEAPVTYPDDGKHYKWNEDTQAWDEYE